VLIADPCSAADEIINLGLRPFATARRGLVNSDALAPPASERGLAPSRGHFTAALPAGGVRKKNATGIIKPSFQRSLACRRADPVFFRGHAAKKTKEAQRPRSVAATERGSVRLGN